jgi:hypothetical protein
MVLNLTGPIVIAAVHLRLGSNAITSITIAITITMIIAITLATAMKYTKAKGGWKSSSNINPAESICMHLRTTSGVGAKGP